MEDIKFIPEQSEVPLTEAMKELEQTMPSPKPEEPKKEKKRPKLPKIKIPFDVKTAQRKLTTFALFGLFALLFAWANTVRRPDNSTLIVIILFSLMVNAIVLLSVFGTDIGIEISKRFLNKFRYKSGRYVNTILVMKSGVMREFFKKKDNETNHFKIYDTKYVTNPTLMFVYRGIPSYVHREGNPDPMNIWEDKYAGDLSNAEMDIVMNAKGMFDLKEWLEANKMFFIIALFAMVAAGCVAAFFGWQNFEILRDGPLPIKEVICSNIPQGPVIPGQQI